MATMTTTPIYELPEHDGDLSEEIDLNSDSGAELQVHFYPPLFLQRRIWILDILRREAIVDVLDVGCGEGQLLRVLSQPAPWLSPPPASIFPDEKQVEEYKCDMPNLHTRRLVGLDVSAYDLAFAVKETKPPSSTPGGEDDMDSYGVRLTRWEDMEAKVWHGGLQVVNEEFVGVECIVCTEVIEHLPPDILPALAPTLLGIYHPKRLLITTPSYTFNARFTRPGAPRSVRARQGYPDPTGRTERIFRHHDHKFEWTPEEFAEWCHGAAEEWGYDIEELGGVGRAIEDDPWGRDEELGDASLVVAFCRKNDDWEERAQRGRQVLSQLELGGEPHKLLATHLHKGHEMARQVPTAESIQVIGNAVKAKMESFREAFIALEQIWFEPDVSTLCGGWIEVLIWAVDGYDGLNLLKGGESSKEWSVELVGGVKDPLVMWPPEGETSIDLIPDGWIPEQEPEEDMSDEGEVSSTGADGYGSWDGSEIETSDVQVSDEERTWGKQDWGADTSDSPWGE
ncbi:hypothetical protein FB45DRAFT_778946 [Roridomyces roridus]|uniref:Small RNA 2'-O-methyltransferase n=1 Tax=Roridomyces roridus TaxID=1738132 RepID=A0AAD7CIN1_9AGAR|nr:hypothetical protein FB45DRAFT_778946 [Roridomyces roridus]